MALNRDTIIKDLKESVIEIFFLPETRFAPLRVTLRYDLLPKSVANDPEQINEIETFHRLHLNFIAAWNVQKHQWVHIPIDGIQYLQMLDGY